MPAPEFTSSTSSEMKSAEPKATSTGYSIGVQQVRAGEDSTIEILQVRESRRCRFADVPSQESETYIPARSAAHSKVQADNMAA